MALTQAMHHYTFGRLNEYNASNSFLREKKLKFLTEIFIIVSGKYFRSIITTSLFVGLIAISPLGAETIKVNTTNDEINTDGDCSLREAIQSANFDIAVDQCSPGNGADKIILKNSILLNIDGTGEDNAATGDLDITDDLVIIGKNAAETIIDGNKLDRVFHVFNGVSFDIRRISITGGQPPGGGGGIFNDNGTVKITNCIVTANEVVLANGGGIFNIEGNMSIINSIITKNTAMHGGGIFNIEGGNVTIRNSLIHANKVDSSGGGIANQGGEISIIQSKIIANESDFGAGGINNTRSTAVGNGIVKISNTLISRNKAGASGGGILNRYGDIFIDKSIISANQAIIHGGGILNEATINITKTIIVNNEPDDCSGCP